MTNKTTQSIDYQVRSRIYGHGKGSVFAPKHFRDDESATGLHRLKSHAATEISIDLD